MKAFRAPQSEVIYFEQKDVIATSGCVCVDCTVCPAGKNNCGCYDAVGQDTNNSL